MAKLKAELDSLDGLDDSLKGLYVEQDGKFRLDAEGVDNSGLKSALEKERKAARDAENRRKDLEARFKDIDPERYAELLKKAEDEEASKGTMEERVSRATEKALAQSRKEIEAAKKDAEDARKQASAFKGRVLDDALRQAAAKAGLHQHAIDDALFRGRAMFTLDENGYAVQLDADGSPVIGKDGKTPFSPSEWLEGMRENAPHWFPANASGSGSGNRQHNSGAPTGKSRKDWTPAEKSAYISKHGRAAYEALPYE